MADALGTAGGVVSAVDHRLDQGGMLAVQGPSALDIRTGVLVGPGSTALVTGTAATGTMTVSIAAHHWVTSRATADGPYLGTKEAAGTVNIAAAPGANSRIDVVYVKQNDAGSTVTPDGSTAEAYGVVTGTAAASPTKPALPVGAIELATVQVAAGATSTNGAGVTITNTARQTVARGVAIPVFTQAERDALTKFIGRSVKRLDDGGRVERWTGTAWAAESDVPVLASISARDTYFSGNLRAGASALVAGNAHIYDGTNWRFTLTGSASGSGDASGYFAFAHGGGRTPTAWGISQSNTGTDGVNYVLRTLAWSADATNLTVRAINDDANAYMTGNPVAVSWWAKF